MISDRQKGILMSHLRKGKTRKVAAAHADMDVKTARKWANRPEFPSECKAVRNWRTRPDPFADVWDGVKDFLGNNPGLHAKTLFEYLQREHPGRFTQGHLRTLQRRIKVWRATEGPPQEVFYPQEHHPGELGASDFTHMSSLDIRVGGQAFPHLLYHFVLTYSNWEWIGICFSETLEALSEGLQNALFALGGAPKTHRTDRMGVAVINWKRASMERSGTDTELRAEFTQSYEALLRHYGMRPQKTQAGHGNENGDVEQRHYRLKCAIDQALMLRGGRDPILTGQGRLSTRSWAPFDIPNWPRPLIQRHSPPQWESAEVQQHRHKPPDNRPLNATTRHCASRLPNREL